MALWNRKRGGFVMIRLQKDRTEKQKDASDSNQAGSHTNMDSIPRGQWYEGLRASETRLGS